MKPAKRPTALVRSGGIPNIPRGAIVFRKDTSMNHPFFQPNWKYDLELPEGGRVIMRMYPDNQRGTHRVSLYLGAPRVGNGFKAKDLGIGQAIHPEKGAGTVNAWVEYEDGCTTFRDAEPEESRFLGDIMRRVLPHATGDPNGATTGDLKVFRRIKGTFTKHYADSQPKHKLKRPGGKLRE